MPWKALPDAEKLEIGCTLFPLFPPRVQTCLIGFVIDDESGQSILRQRFENIGQFSQLNRVLHGCDQQRGPIAFAHSGISPVIKRRAHILAIWPIKCWTSEVHPTCE